MSFIFNHTSLQKCLIEKKKNDSRTQTQTHKQSITHLKFLNKLLGIGGRDYDVALGRLNKAIIHGFVNKSEEVVVVAINIEQTHLQNLYP